jgi:hypothetical protein
MDEPVCPGCGNGVVEPGEACDGADLMGYTCLSLGFTSGALACASGCVFDTSGCSAEICGNLMDDDGDGLYDCGDLDCDPSPACGDEPTGAACTMDAQCDGGICLTEGGSGFPAGSCSEPCDLATGLCGADGDAYCYDLGTPDGLGRCLEPCTPGSTTCRSGYFCTGVCLPQCHADVECPVTDCCDETTGLCGC